ncbi:MAG: MlaD family protein [Gemmatimonadota bacterium]|nr:MlaD family protein [Gemmatimonadota bacterium]
MNRGKELLVGLVIIGAIIVGVGGTLWLQGTNFGVTLMPIDVRLESAGQLAEGNVVTYRGVPIGQVSRIQVEPGGEAVRVSLLLDEEVTLPDDAGVVLGPESLFGAWQAEIVSRDAYPRFPFFEVEDSVIRRTVDRRGMEQPESVPVLGGYALPEISRLTASAEEISGNLAELTERFEIAFNQETADNLARAIGNIEAITEEVRTLVNQQAAVAEALTANADSALGEIQTAAVAARTSFERVDGLLADEKVDSMITNVSVASQDLRRIMEQLTDSTGGLDGTLQRADSTFARIDRMTERLERGEGSLGRLLTDTTFAVQAEGVLAQLDRLLADFRENPGRYVRLSIF